MSRPTRAIVDLDAIAANYRLLESAAGGPGRVLPVVKADAYGHGAVAVARRLVREGARRFAVALLEEGAALRAAAIHGEILLLSTGYPEDAAELAALRIAPAIHLAQARDMAEAVRSLPAPLPVHLKLDTGMGRLGVLPEHVPEMAELLRRSKGIVALAGTFTQFACADDPHSPATEKQLRVFEEALRVLRSGGLDPGLVHASNSAGTLHFPSARFDAVRPGIALYGIEPSEAAARETSRLRPALSLESRVMAVRRVPAGTPLGYGGTFVTTRATSVAVLPIGYHDGLRRSFSGRSSVLLRGARAPVVGAVSMDLTLVDATDAAAEAGDAAVILGRSGGDEVGAWELARAAGTNPYEILCGIGARVPREYVP